MVSEDTLRRGFEDGAGGFHGRLIREGGRCEEAERAVRWVLADGAYDSKANFDFLSGKEIRPVIRVAKNSLARGKGVYAR
ncbi:MAG: hypothetical protein JRN68_02300 [Nitrososphaerota archaeon]|nr:hypothetical protein [Nitrososphaerota archaeon]